MASWRSSMKASKAGPVQPAGMLLRRQRRGSTHSRAGINPGPTAHPAAGFALHYGTVAYGNIGSGDRLDFTVIGRDVNLTSRIERLCRELDQQLIMSGEIRGPPAGADVRDRAFCVARSPEDAAPFRPAARPVIWDHRRPEA